MSNILIEARNITKTYDADLYFHRGKNINAISNVNFILEEGDFTCIMGPSGSGKSTLLHCLSTLDRVSRGQILFKNTDMSTLSKNQLCDFRYQSLGFVFQDHNLIPYLSIFDNIASPIMLGELKTIDIKEKVISIAKKLEIDHLLDKFPSECSGGECQRVAIARALINNPQILICDEPTGNLDSTNSHRVLTILSQLNQQGTSILLVTHDAMIASYAKTMMYLYDGGIQTVIHKNQMNQLDFYHQIQNIVNQDSLIEKFTENQIAQENKLSQENESSPTDNIRETSREFVSRQNVYMIIDGQPYDEQKYKSHTHFLIKDAIGSYTNAYYDEIQIDFHDIQEINLDLKAKYVMFGVFSQFVFYIYMDLKSEKGTYQFQLANQNDFPLIIEHLKQFNIPIHDSRDILNAYQQFPDEVERNKYYQRTHKDLIKRGAYKTTNAFVQAIEKKKKK